MEKFFLKVFEISTNKKEKRFGYDEGEKIVPEGFEVNNVKII